MSEHTQNRRQNRRRYDVHDGDVSGTFCGKGVRCPTGEARITPGFKLPAKFVIHIVRPVYRDGQHGEPEQLVACYRNSLVLAAENGCKSIAFPCISTSIYGYSKEETVQISVREAKAFLAASTSAPPCATADEEDAEMDMIFCCFSAHGAAVYERFHNTRRTEET